VRATTDAAGHVTASYRTDEYGVVTEAAGGGGQPFGFTGEQRDATGLVYLRARMYDPNVGRFMQRDTYPGGMGSSIGLHRYAYVGNNPINATDPSGHDPYKLNKVLRGGLYYSNDCFIGNREGTGVYYNVIGCTDLQWLTLMRIVFQTPLGPQISTGVSLSSPGGGGSGPGESGEGGRGSRGKLYRFGLDPESAEKLASDAAKAEQNGFPHGVSTMSRTTRPDASPASRAEVEEHFPVHKTGKNPYHYTVELPKPVTETVAELFNRLFGR
jgi:RHS repeat-associated protein